MDHCAGAPRAYAEALVREIHREEFLFTEIRGINRRQPAVGLLPVNKATQAVPIISFLEDRHPPVTGCFAKEAIARCGSRQLQYQDIQVLCRRRVPETPHYIRELELQAKAIGDFVQRRTAGSSSPYGPCNSTISQRLQTGYALRGPPRRRRIRSYGLRSFR